MKTIFLNILRGFNNQLESLLFCGVFNCSECNMVKGLFLCGAAQIFDDRFPTQFISANSTDLPIYRKIRILTI